MLETIQHDAPVTSAEGTLGVAEVFYSIQGEGKTMGIPAVFLRLSGCNLLCGGQGTVQDKQLHDGAKWRCDTIEVWLKRTKTPYADVLPQEYIDRIREGAHLVITGGEPTLQEAALVGFLTYLKQQAPFAYVEIETNGTRFPDKLVPFIDLFNCSPKLSNSGNAKARRFFPDVIRALDEQHTIFKFVIFDEEDLAEMIEDYAPLLDARKVYLMPAGENIDLLKQTEQRVVEMCKQHVFNYSGRLHINIWNKKTGV